MSDNLPTPNAEQLAAKFHETYERLAPQYGTGDFAAATPEGP